ncbi:MAG: hypothetical protein D6687_08040 [Acidobacteria bacterium]|jgi:hypothetical protein|nr:MAG: hypothetical protein D6687_08040 [Acidobacteriota bacterium]GIU81545.1 MAG: hypothetical protein KatS3mg006_0609 [Pyrinomonadaceae bacterium]
MSKVNAQIFLLVSFVLSLELSVEIAAQDIQNPSLTRPRVVVASDQTKSPDKKSAETHDSSINSQSQKTNPNIKVNPLPTPIVITNKPSEPKTNTKQVSIEDLIEDSSENVKKINESNRPLQQDQKSLNLAKLKSKIAEAKRLLQSRPLPTAMNDASSVDTSIVRLAFYDFDREKLDFVAIPKFLFLQKGAEFPAFSADGKKIIIRIIRGNGVNTPVTILDENGKLHLPLLVQYPIEKNGKYQETAYYVSTHTGLVIPEVVQAGKVYVRNIIDTARNQLKSQGIFISKEIADIAERLVIVEHVDHARFRNEPHQKIFDDIYTLYALNEGQTYRYSVSRAGAGGMVQMIPSTYSMVRNRFYMVGLIPDFVEGMRNHLNAAKAMLLYMHMTWNDLILNSTVYEALQNQIATQKELLAAGYNSNPARLPLYIQRGGANWKNLLPAETRIYLEIYRSMEFFVPIEPRKE